MADLSRLNSNIQTLEDVLEHSPFHPQKLHQKQNNNVQNTTTQTPTQGFAARNALLRELHKRVAKGQRHHVRATLELIMWKDQHIKQTSVSEYQGFGGIAAQGLAHDVVTIYGGGKNKASFCIPMNASNYNFRKLMNDLSRLWNLPPTTFPPLFQLVGNADPFLEGTYNFLPHRFAPTKNVQWELRDLREDATRGYGTQTGVAHTKVLPTIHCRPIVSSGTIDAFVKIFEADNKDEQIQVYNSLLGHDQDDDDDDDNGTMATYQGSGALNGEATHNGNPSSATVPMSQTEYDLFLATVAQGKNPQETSMTYNNGNALFNTWSDSVPNVVTGTNERVLSFVNFGELIKEWGELRKEERRLHEGLSARKAWNIFEKPTRFVGSGTGAITVRFDEFASAVRLHNKTITTENLHLLFDKMDRDRGGSVTFDEFYAYWSTLKVDLFDNNVVKENSNTTSELNKLKENTQEHLAYYLPFFLATKKPPPTKKATKTLSSMPSCRSNRKVGTKEMSFCTVFCTF